VYGLDDEGLDFVTSGNFLSRKNIAKLSAFRERVESGDIEVPDRLE
jgi:hypothetical protein